jgi:AcrR family transcriptional regulator
LPRAPVPDLKTRLLPTHLVGCGGSQQFVFEAVRFNILANTTEVAEISGGVSNARRGPSQKRSRERRERILEAASAIIERKGSEGLKMNEIAGIIGISMGSLCQYFPDKRSIIRMLAERYISESRMCIREAFATVHDRASLQKAYLDLMDLYYAIVLAKPVMRDIWSGMQADKELIALQLAESRLMGAELANAMKRIHPKAGTSEIDASAFLVWELGEAAVRLAISLDRKQGDGVIETFKRMSVREVMQQ